jgi:uncharacterized protein
MVGGINKMDYSDYLNSSEFTQDQKQEIEKGILAGVDVSVFARPEYLAIQMLQIRIGLEEKLPVEIYASDQYDWFQMEEIRKGLEHGIDIKKYAAPEIPFDVMCQLREGLEQGIDLSFAKKLNAGVLKQLRLALVNRIDIVPYINQGYDEEQLEQIRIALENKIDVNPYITTLSRGTAIREIVLGLEENIDVSLYADEKMNWQQMREIRLGLEERLDVECYRNILYSWQQMREIRIGLEEGLDVSYYSSLMYSPKEMRKRRLRISGKDEYEAEAERKDEREEFKVIVSSDNMKVYLAADIGCKILKEDILLALGQRGITYGIDYTKIEDIVSNGTGEVMEPIAQGKYPEAGSDGWYEYFFDTEVKPAPTLLENGSVDYQNIKWFEMVKKGQCIASYHKAAIGSEGINVYGRTIPGLRGKEVPAISGTGFKILPDGLTYVADLDGKIEMKDGKIEITEVLILDSVNGAVGNIKFSGSIYIKGSVSDNVEIQCGKDLLVDGFVESAVIKTGGNIVIRKGNNAGGRGYIEAGGSIMGKFFENTRVAARKDIKSNYCLNSILSAGEHIEVSGISGSIAGGSATAGDMIQSYNIGNSAEIATAIKVGRNREYNAEQTILKTKEDEINREITLLGNSYADFQRKYPPDVRNTNKLYIKIENAIYTKKKELKEVSEQRKVLEEKTNKNKLAKVVIRGTVFNGVKIEVNGSVWEAKPASNITLRKSGSSISIYKNR